jgi:hypothetical protein
MGKGFQKQTRTEAGESGSRPGRSRSQADASCPVARPSTFDEDAVSDGNSQAANKKPGKPGVRG